MLNNAISSESQGKGGIYSWQKNKATNILIASGVQFPGVKGIPDGFIESIDDNLSNVKRKIQLETCEDRERFLALQL